MKKTATILAALAMGVASASAGVSYAPSKGPAPSAPPPMDPCAGPISYNNIELLYASTDWGGDNGGYDDSSDGGILRAEYSPMQNFYIAGGVEYTDVDFGDLWIFNIGLGGYFPLTENIHIAADAGYLYARFDLDDDDDNGTKGGSGDDDSDSEDGWYARPHLRAKWGCFSAKAGALYRDLGDDDNGDDNGDWSYFVQLYYQLTPSWDITAGYMDGDNDFEQWTAGVRYRY